MRFKRTVPLEAVITVVSLRGNWIKLLQVRSAGEGKRSLLGMKARRVEGSSEPSVAEGLREMIRSLPAPPGEVVGLLPSGEILTRYLRLPSTEPAELKAMAYYQLEGQLPFSVQECVTSVRVLEVGLESSRVLAAVVQRSVVERLIRVCSGAGLSLSRITASSGGIGNWHRLCRPGGQGSAQGVWLVVEVGPEGIEAGVLVRDQLIYMRQLSYLPADLDGLAAQLKETIRAYQREQAGPPVEQVSLSGRLEAYGPETLDRLSQELNLPVLRIDPLESSPLRESLSVTVQELEPEVSFSDLLGTACSPRMLQLDLLPWETQLQRAQERLNREARKSAVVVGLAAALFFAWIGAKVGATVWLLRQTQHEVETLEPQVVRVRKMMNSIHAGASSRHEYALRARRLSEATGRLAPGMTLQFLGLDAEGILTLRGASPDLDGVMAYAAGLRHDSLWKGIGLRSVKRGQESRGVEFELVLRPTETEER